jgi:hypothetical protein
MIQKLMTISRTTEVNATSERIVGAYKKTGLSSDAHLSGMMTGLEDDQALFTDAIKRMKAESELEAQDELRDGEIRSLYYLVLGLLHHPDEAIKTAAGKVFTVLEHYGLAVADESYASESSLVGSMLADLAKPGLQEPIAALSGCAGCIAKLQTAENNFDATRIAFEEEKGWEGTLENATVIKRRVVNLINQKLVVYLLAMEQVTPETYGSLARTVAEIIADNNEVVKRRRKKTEATA